MQINKRQKEIKDILSTEKQVDVQELSRQLGVTDVTIRRDLEKLEEDGFLTRTHGGAILNEEDVIKNEESALFDLNLSKEESTKYQNIAEIASKLIEDNDSIFLGSGTSCRFLVRNLHDKNNISVATPDMLVALDCAFFCPNISIILTGGQLNSSTLQLAGNITEISLKNFFFNKSFFDIDGITLNRGYSASSIDKAFLTRFVKEISSSAFALCPYTNFDHESTASIGNMGYFSSIITNEHTPEEYKEYFFQHDIRIYATVNTN